MCNSLDGRRLANLKYVLGLKKSVLPTSIWHSLKCAHAACITEMMLVMLHAHKRTEERGNMEG
jgi:hypothetical protein